MKKETVVMILLILICGLILVGMSAAANDFVIGRNVIGGGGQESTGGDYALNGTIAEPIASELHISSAFGLSSGFWRLDQTWTVFLPLVLR